MYGNKKTAKLIPERARPDKFGNPTIVVGCKDKKDSGYSKGYFTLNGELFKVEPSKAQKDGIEHWVRITNLGKSMNQ